MMVATRPHAEALPSGLGRANGPTPDVALSRWFRYAAGFSADSLERSFTALELRPKALVADPFAGVATAGVAAVDRGHSFHGIEAHRLVAEIGQLKFARPGPADGLSAAAQVIVERSNMRGPTAAEETTLVKSSFPADVLDELVALREAIKASRSPWRLHLKWALLASLRDLAAVNVGWPYQRPTRERTAPYTKATARFLQRVDVMVGDLRALSEDRGCGTVVQGDSRLVAGWSGLRKERVDGCVSSPPYLNNFDYADATRLELYFWGELRTWRDLTVHLRSQMVRAATHQTTDGAAADAKKRLMRMPATLARVTEIETELAVQRAKRPRGKQYDRLLVCYAADMVDVLSHLFQVLRPGGKCAWTIGDSAPYGVYIDTPALIASFASELGFETVGTETLRSRGLRWRTNGTRHQVALCEKVLLFRRPL
jgi:hypothetical protein